VKSLGNPYAFVGVVVQLSNAILICLMKKVGPSSNSMERCPTAHLGANIISPKKNLYAKMDIKNLNLLVLDEYIKHLTKFNRKHNLHYRLATWATRQQSSKNVSGLSSNEINLMLVGCYNSNVNVRKDSSRSTTEDEMVQSCHFTHGLIGFVYGA